MTTRTDDFVDTEGLLELEVISIPDGVEIGLDTSKVIVDTKQNWPLETLDRYPNYKRLAEGLRFWVGPGDFNISRSNTDDLIITDTKYSRKPLTISRENGAYEVEQAAPQPAIVDGNRLSKGSSIELGKRGMIKVGTSDFILQYHDEGKTELLYMEIEGLLISLDTELRLVGTAKTDDERDAIEAYLRYETDDFPKNAERLAQLEYKFLFAIMEAYPNLVSRPTMSSILDGIDLLALDEIGQKAERQRGDDLTARVRKRMHQVDPYNDRIGISKSRDLTKSGWKFIRESRE